MTTRVPRWWVYLFGEDLRHCNLWIRFRCTQSLHQLRRENIKYPGLKPKPLRRRAARWLQKLTGWWWLGEPWD